MRIIACLVLFVLTAWPPARAEPVDLELVLLADASGSIGNDEIRYQRRQGYADALSHDDTLDAIRLEAGTGRSRSPTWNGGNGIPRSL